MLVLCARVQQQAGGSAATVYRTASSIAAQVPLLRGTFVPSDFCAAIQGSPLFGVPLLRTVDCILFSTFCGLGLDFDIVSFRQNSFNQIEWWTRFYTT